MEAHSTPFIDPATYVEPSERRRKLTFNGEARTMSEWADQIGISYHALKSRLKKMPLERALTMPPSPAHPHADARLRAAKRTTRQLLRPNDQAQPSADLLHSLRVLRGLIDRVLTDASKSV